MNFITAKFGRNCRVKNKTVYYYLIFPAETANYRMGVVKVKLVFCLEKTIHFFHFAIVTILFLDHFTAIAGTDFHVFSFVFSSEWYTRYTCAIVSCLFYHSTCFTASMVFNCVRSKNSQ